MEEKLEDGVIYANLGDMEMKFNVETLFEILENLDDEEEYDDVLENLDDEEEYDDILENFESIKESLEDSTDIVAFTYDGSKRSNDRRDFIGECLGIFTRESDILDCFKIGPECFYRIADSWEWALKHNIENGVMDTKYLPTVDGNNNGQWSVKNKESGEGRVMFCYAKDVHKLIKPENDEAIDSLLYFYL